ncbi:MAG: vitamin K epoxide reductase family protein, partial [Bacteroidales bacterium]|nr:vitamin K epoxide reductase family protein [Bacteroidales bacterium]
MTDYIKPVRIKQSWPWWGWVPTILNISALILSLIMSWHYLTGGSIAGCGGGSPCEQVLSSRWSVIAGILPVSGLAVGTYLAMFVCSLYIGPASEISIRRLAWSVLLIMSGSITGSALWFIILQKWVIGAFCPYCMATHLTGLLLSFLIIRKVTFKSEGEPAERLIRPATVTGLVISGLVLAAIMAVSQISFKP